MANYLYITDDNNKIIDITKYYAKENGQEFICIKNNAEGMGQIRKIYNTLDNIALFVPNLTKSSVSNALLKILEDNKRNIDMYATSNTYDVSEALQARFIIRYFDNKNIEKEVKQFIKTKKASKEVYSSISFYIALANNTAKYKNLQLINNIIKEAQKCTYNIPWDYYYNLIRENYINEGFNNG